MAGMSELHGANSGHALGASLALSPTYKLGKVCMEVGKKIEIFVHSFISVCQSRKLLIFLLF
jgi:hypothetical protein